MSIDDYLSREQKRTQDKEKLKLRREQLLSDMDWLLSDERGRNVIGNILAECRLMDSNFTGNSETFKLEGRREVALSLVRWMREASPKNARKLIGDLFVGQDD